MMLLETSGVDIRRIVTRTSMTRLDGIAVDSKYLYWCETNTNTVARALRRDFQRQVVVGGTANSMLSWPRGIALGSDDGDINDLKHSFYYSEYTGRVSRGSSQTVIVNEVSAPAMQYVDSVTSLAILFAISATSTDADVSGNLRHESRTLQAKYTSTSQYAASMLASVNAQRAAQGLPALCMNAKLMAASMRHSTDMAVNNFMSHTGSDGSTMSMRVTAAGYKWTRVAENVAAGQSSVAAVMTSWMNSPGHRANILGDYTMFGTAYAYNMAARTTLLDAKLWQGQHRGVQLRGRRVRGCSDSNSKFHDRFDGQLDGGASQRAIPEVDTTTKLDSEIVL
ncbi:CAP domain [Phytophthora cactorum]|nr:CAP domain [Phytophthora cactorum]